MLDFVYSIVGSTVSRIDLAHALFDVGGLQLTVALDRREPEPGDKVAPQLLGVRDAAVPEHLFKVGVSHRPLLSAGSGYATSIRISPTCLALPRAISSVIAVAQSLSLYRPGCVFDGPLRIT
jgi:hypothetical protein